VGKLKKEIKMGKSQKGESVKESVSQDQRSKKTAGYRNSNKGHTRTAEEAEKANKEKKENSSPGKKQLKDRQFQKEKTASFLNGETEGVHLVRKGGLSRKKRSSQSERKKGK